MIVLSPLNQRRFQNFKLNKRGWYSFLIFSLLFFISLFGDFIANDKPLLVKFDNQFYFPIFSNYPETVFGGDFETETDYHDPYVQNLIYEKGGIIWPIIPYSYDTIIRDLDVPAPAPPSKKNWLGTDDLARDVLARLIYGFRISILFGLTLTFFSMIIGVSAGAIQGYFGGRIDLFFQRFMEIWSAIPTLYVLIILASIVQPNFWWLLIILLLFSWMGWMDGWMDGTGWILLRQLVLLEHLRC